MNDVLTSVAVFVLLLEVALFIGHVRELDRKLARLDRDIADVGRRADTQYGMLEDRIRELNGEKGVHG